MRPTRAAAAGKNKGQNYGKQKCRLPLRDRLKDLAALLKLVWRQGILADFRVAILAAVAGGLPAKPQPLAKYLEKCGMGKISFWIRETPAGPSRAGPGRTKWRMA